MKKQLFFILNLVIIISFSCKKKEDLSFMDEYLGVKYSEIIKQNEMVSNRLNELIGENKRVLLPLIATDPELEKSEFCYEFFGESIENKIGSSTILVFDFVQNTIALAYKSSEQDSITYLFEDKDKIPMPIHFIMEEEFINNQ